MRNSLSPKLLFLILMLAAFAGSIFGQDGPPPQRDVNRPPEMNKPPGDRQMQPKRPNLIRLLGLTPDQAQQLKKLNQDRKPQMDEAMQRLRNANRALDEAIYADTVDEAAFQSRLKEVNQAQAEVARLRFTNELAVRKILTADQLARFRDLRRRFAPPPDHDGPEPGDKPMPGQQMRHPSDDRPN